MKKETYLTILCILIFSITCVLLAVNISQGKLVAEQNRIIALQQDYQFELESTLETLEKQLEDEKEVSNVLYSICELNDLLQEVKDE